jgi:hypothetical protein
MSKAKEQLFKLKVVMQFHSYFLEFFKAVKLFPQRFSKSNRFLSIFHHKNWVFFQCF